jgi:tRNA pseudouridine synthase B-like protein
VASFVLSAASFASPTGVLPLVTGSLTRLAQFYTTSQKTYEGVVRFGFATDTYDADGEPSCTAQSVNLQLRQVADLAARFRGVIEQMPPPFSAKKVHGVSEGSVAKLSVHRRASVPLEILVDLGGTPPFRVQPDQNSQGTNLQGTGRKNPHLPQTGIIDCRYIGSPYRPPCGEQATKALFRRNAERISPATGLASRLSDGRIRRRSRQIEIAFASSVPVYELVLIVFSHTFTVPRKRPRAHVTTVTCMARNQGGRPQIEPERRGAE